MGNEASDTIRQDHNFQCALVDIMLPGKDGYALLPELKRFGIPVIFLTAKADLSSKVKGLKEGAEDYIVKPFEMLEVMVRLKKYWSATAAPRSSFRLTMSSLTP